MVHRHDFNVFKTKRSTESTFEKPLVTERRLDNFFTSFKLNNLRWDRSSIKLTLIGLGDRPAFQIDGKISNIIKVRWHSFTPGGGQARMYYWIDGKRYRLNAPQKDANMVLLKILSHYEQLEEEGIKV